MSREFQNVKESWFLYDTVGVSPWLSNVTHPVAGWYENFSDFAQADSISFFDSRNKSIGLAYNNQDSRDQIPYALVADSISIGFFAPTCASMIGRLLNPAARARLDHISSFWDCELPQHTSVIFRVNQDERLKTNAALVAPGYGAVGGSMGQGDISLSGGGCTTVAAQGQGRAHLKYRWEFPNGIGIPRRATMVTELRLVEWARDVLGTLWGPGYFELRDSDPGGTPEHPTVYQPTMFMIQCLITGRREVQQRGEYHA